MQVIDLGDCPINSYDEPLDYEWFVSDYAIGSYEGSGRGVGYKNDRLYFHNLGHCSCYGPMENGSDFDVTVRDYLEADSAIGSVASFFEPRYDGTSYDKLKDKINELLGFQMNKPKQNVELSLPRKIVEALQRGGYLSVGNEETPEVVELVEMILEENNANCG